MMTSKSICTGFGVGGRQIEQTDTCILAGFVVYHRFPEPKELRKTFHQLRRPDLAEICSNSSQIESKFVEEVSGSNKEVFNEWKLHFDNVIKNRNSDKL